MSAVINITVIKPFPSSKLGIAWIIEDNCVKITKVREGGLFWESGLKEGQEIIAINRTHVDGFSWDEVKAIFASIETTISITARTKPFIASFDMDRQMSCDRHQIPEILEAAGVPLYKWRKIYQLIESEMVEATSKSVEMDQIYRDEMCNYTNKQMIKGGGWMGPGQESHHEKKVFHMTHQCAALANNATLVATNVSIRANALLVPHDITVSLYLRSLKLPRYSTKQSGEAHVALKPYGLRFMSLLE